MNERTIELDLVGWLKEAGYTHRPDICDRLSLETNFRKRFEELNQVRLTDAEFDRLLDKLVTADAFAASRALRETNSFEREDGTPLYFTLLNTKDWCKNTFEVVNQLRMNTDYSQHRYDVVLLINGLPVVQIELKTLAVSPRKAMEQIVDYKADPGSSYSRTLFCFLQLFVVSNRSDTWYFTNNNAQHFNFGADERFLPVYRFADKDNQKITHLAEFASRFLAKCELAEMIGRYIVLVESEQKLLAMRPYQIYAVKAIVDCIHENCGNGYVWHTTGSGKTLTSFKAATLLKDNPDVHKCLFVVDRKDLDRQTREEFNRFQSGSVEENTNTEALVRRLLSRDYADKVIVTTIQKLGLALDGNNRQNYKQRLEPLSEKRVVFIFDECHRSQFGENHRAIREFFPNAQLFGFTGTPIFEENATSTRIDGRQAFYKTTESVFERELHAYTITNAIEDANVLRFHVDYYKPDEVHDVKPGEPIAKRAVVASILEKHDQVTANRKFNALLATASINDAIEYFRLFKEVQTQRVEADSSFVPLRVAAVFSPPAEGDKDVIQIQEDLPQESADNEEAPEEKKAALKEIIADYNAAFGTNHSLAEFDAYYQDVQKRIKDQQYPDADLPHEKKLDLVIVVEMLLTGFDSKYLNTLYVDKRLKHHGLIQAFSRTNRVLNATKPFGNILDFRAQEAEVNAAVTLFSGEKVERAPEIWLVDPAPVVIERLEEATGKLKEFMQSQGLEYKPEDVLNLKGDAARAKFIDLFKDLRRLSTQLDQYTELSDEETAKVEAILPEEQLQAFQGTYLETAKRLMESRRKEGDDAAEEAKQLDFEFVLFASALIDYDYIMGLIAKYTQEPPGKQTMTRNQLVGLIQADAKFIDDRDDIAAYIGALSAGKALDKDSIREGFEKFKREREMQELRGIAERHGLSADGLQRIVEDTVRLGVFSDEQLRALLVPLGLGWKERGQKALAVMDDVLPLLKKQGQGRAISGLKVYERQG
ncbi:MAG: type I restriction endonuclease subunit R [Trueperaceae bacterium]|nr:type I restriction endonuclease subunit R [Trueperaceae bacterium]